MGTRVLMPRSRVRLAAGRLTLSDEAQALCFLAGANSIFFGERLLTTPNPQIDRDLGLLNRLGLDLQEEVILGAGEDLDTLVILQVSSGEGICWACYGKT